MKVFGTEEYRAKYTKTRREVFVTTVVDGQALFTVIGGYFAANQTLNEVMMLLESLLVSIEIEMLRDS